MQSPVLTLSMQSKKSLRSFVVYQKKKFAMYGFCANHLKGNGRPSVPGRKIAQVKRLMNNKERRSTRSFSNSLSNISCKNHEKNMDIRHTTSIRYRKYQISIRRGVWSVQGCSYVDIWWHLCPTDYKEKKLKVSKYSNIYVATKIYPIKLFES